MNYYATHNLIGKPRLRGAEHLNINKCKISFLAQVCSIPAVFLSHRNWEIWMDRIGLHARPARSEGFWKMWENESKGMSLETVLIIVYVSQWERGRRYKTQQ